MTVLQKKKMILAELAEGQNGDKGKNQPNERSKWAPDPINKQILGKASKNEKREIINNDVVIKVAKRVLALKDEEDIELPKKVVKKPEPKKKVRAAWVDVIDDNEEEEKQESKPISINWPSSTPVEPSPEKKQTVEKIQTAEDLEYLEFQKYQENIRAAHRESIEIK
jgi:hypothetical protein